MIWLIYQIFCILFADDTNVFITGKNIDTMIALMNDELQKIAEWLQVNKFSINIKKTQYMIFSLKTTIITNNEVCINNNILERVYSAKFLGVIVDSKLNWNEHIKYIKKKISMGIGIISAAKKHFSLPTLKILYFSFIYPYYTYCVEVWGNACQTHLLSLIKLQKRIVRIISYSSYKAHTDPIFTKLHILKLHQVYKYSIFMFMFKYYKNELPSIFNNVFNKNIDVHPYPTRQCYKLHLPKSKTTALQKSVKYNGVIIWNCICDKVDNDWNIILFKKRVKQYLITNPE